MVPNPVVFFEIGCEDTPSTAEFYSQLFDWNVSSNPMGADIDPKEGIHGRITSLGHEPLQYTIFYVEVEDVAAAIEKAVSVGGTAVVGPIQIPHGTFAWIKDPGWQYSWSLEVEVASQTSKQKIAGIEVSQR